jgi:hypothetical protein
MATARSSAPEIVITGVERVNKFSWADIFHAHLSSWSEFESRNTLPSVTVFCAARYDDATDKYLGLLAKKCLHASSPSIVLCYLDEPKLSWENMAQQMGRFPGNAHIDFLFASDNAENTIYKVCARALAFRHHGVHAVAHHSKAPLTEERSRVEETLNLRSDKGRLSVAKIAETFGLSKAKLASLLGSSRQQASQTDDAASLQPKLEPFEQIARLRRELDQKQFLAWLNSPHKLLEQKSPLSLIQEERVEVVADLVEDMLTGSPT